MTGRNSAEALSATRQNTSWDVLNSYGSGRCAFNFKINDDFWWKWKSILDISDIYLSDWSRFHNTQKEKLWNFDQFYPIAILRRTRKIAQFQLVQNTVNELCKIFWLVGHLVIKTVCCSLWPRSRAAGQVEIVNHLAVNKSQKLVVSGKTHFTISSCQSFSILWTACRLPVI